MTKELWDIYDRQGRKLEGSLLRGEPIPEGQYHLVSCVLVRHRDGRFLLMHRSSQKEVWPDAWEIGVGGSALRGETSEAAARRELREETGIEDGQWSFMARSVEETAHAIYDGFLCITDIPPEQIRLQPGENDGFRWLSPEEFLTFFDSGECIPRIHRRLESYVESLRKFG